MRRYNRKSRSRKKRSVKRKTKSVLKTILDVMNPVKRTQLTSTYIVNNAVNYKNYVDLAKLGHLSLDYAFMSLDHLQACISNANRLNIAWSPNDEWYIRSAVRKYEFTNICNSIIYLTINEYIPKQDMQVANGVLASSGISGFVNGTLNNIAYFPDSGVAATQLLGVNQSFGWTSPMVFDDALANPQVKTAFAVGYKMKLGKELAVKPQQTVLFYQSQRYPFLFAPNRRYIGSNSAPATDFKGVTKRLIVSMTGQTARATGARATLPEDTTNNYVNSAPSRLHVTSQDMVVVQQRQNAVPVNEVQVLNSAGYLPVGVAFEFGDDNNNAVPIQ